MLQLLSSSSLAVLTWP